VGCHTGLFLSALPSAWTRLGIESALAPAAAAKARGVRIISDRIETVTTEWQGRCDVVTLFDVLEHLPDPADAIARAKDLLRPGGLLLVSSADMDRWTWRWGRGRHWYLQTPQHLSIISRPFLAWAARRHGLRLERVEAIAHHRVSPKERSRQALRTIYWGLKARGGLLRAPQRLLHSLPGCASFRHMREIPWSMGLRDHLLAVFKT
jgi:SAM-dependent methyltransferase